MTHDDASQRDIMLALHDVLTGFPGVRGKMRFNIPFYDRNRWLCYLNPLKNGGVELSFCQADRLSNEQGLLDFRGRTQVAGVTFRQVADIRPEVLLEVLQEAMMVDDTLGRPGKRKRPPQLF